MQQARVSPPLAAAALAAVCAIACLPSAASGLVPSRFTPPSSLAKGNADLALELRQSVGKRGWLRGGAEGIPKEIPNKPTKYRLFVANLPQGLNDAGLYEAFMPFGTIEEAKVLRDIETGQSRRMAYVSFKKMTEMDEALDEMHQSTVCAKAPGSSGPPVCTKMEVHEAKPQRQTW